MASKKDPLKGARAHLKNDEPYQAWELAQAQPPSVELQRVLIQALQMVGSDLDEHGENNLPLYGDGSRTEDEWKELLKTAKAELRRLEGKPPSTLGELARGPDAVMLGAPKEICGPLS